MLVKRFTVVGLNLSTKRRKTLVLPAKTIGEARDYAIKQGLGEPFEITETPPDPPSVEQIEYAAGLGAHIPNGASRQDLSAIIQKKLDNDREPSRDLIDYANHQGFIFSEYIGKKALYDVVFSNLNSLDKSAFFVFSIYRWLTDDRRGNLETHPDKQKFYDFATQLEGSEQMLKSIARYEGNQLRYFGRLITPDGYELQGGSVNTLAYKAASSYLEGVFTISASRKTVRLKPDALEPIFHQPQTQKEKKGCTFLLLNLALFVSLLVFLAIRFL